jgi:DNA mismatch repair protein MutL
MGRIHRLSDELINQIAAGEVVERPASVVKELAENAVDAGARTVRVELERGGTQLIRVLDDGVGMSRDDARLSLERHATSKLADAAGLFQIVTKGFRGEALPSIASVARFRLSTCEALAPAGTRLELDGGGPPVVSDEAPVAGTRVEVTDLFFNTPARRKFLKREATELTHCEEAVVRLALAHLEVGFFLAHEGRTLISAPATGSLVERVSALLGAAAVPHLLEVEERRLGLALTGVVASPEFTLPTARGLYTFVNRRYVRDRGLTSAVQRGFQDSLPPGRQPVAVLFLEVDPQAVDVNVHPQKLEVRFSDPRSVGEVVLTGVKRALQAAPWRSGPEGAAPSSDPHYALAVDRFLARAATGPLPFVEVPMPGVGDGGRAPFGTSRPGLNEAAPRGYFGSLRFIGPLGAAFWVAEAPGGTLVVLDARAVRERAMLGRLLQPPGPASSLFATRVARPRSGAPALLARAGELRALGLELEAFGGDALAVRSLPAALQESGLEEAALGTLLEALAEALEGAGPGEVRARALPILAAQAAAGPARAVSHDEASRLLAALDGLDLSIPAQRRKVVVHQLPLLQLEAEAG